MLISDKIVAVLYFSDFRVFKLDHTLFWKMAASFEVKVLDTPNWAKIGKKIRYD